MKRILSAVLLMICLGITFFIGAATAAEEIPKLTKEQLKVMLDDANLIIIDVRLGPDWTDSDAKIKGAVHENPMQMNAWADKYPKDKTLVFYCS